MLRNLHRVLTVVLLPVAVCLLQLTLTDAQTCPAPTDANEQCYCTTSVNICNANSTSSHLYATEGDNITISCHRMDLFQLYNSWSVQLGDIVKTASQSPHRQTDIIRFNDVQLVLENLNCTSCEECTPTNERCTYSLHVVNVSTALDGLIVTCGARYTLLPKDQHWYSHLSHVIRVGPAINIKEEVCQDIRPVGELVRDVEDGGNVTVTCESRCAAGNETLWMVQVGNSLTALHNDTERQAFEEEHGQVKVSMDHDNVSSSLTLEGVGGDLDHLVIKCGETIRNAEGYAQASYSQYTVVLHAIGGNTSKDELIISLQGQVQNCSQELNEKKAYIQNMTCEPFIIAISILVGIILSLLIALTITCICFYKTFNNRRNSSIDASTIVKNRNPDRK